VVLSIRSIEGQPAHSAQVDSFPARGCRVAKGHPLKTSIRKRSSKTGKKSVLPTPDTSELAAPAAPEAAGSDFAILLLAGAGLVFVGQSLSAVLLGPDKWKSYPFTVLGLGFFLIAARAFSRGRLDRWLGQATGRLAYWFAVRPYQVILLALAPLLSVAAWVAAGDGPLMKSAWLAAGTWLLGILCVFAANWDRKSRLEFSAVSRPDLLIACLVFVAALLLRGLLIGQIPWLLTGDESSAGLSAVEFVRGVRNNLFGVGWYSFPSLYFFVQSLSIRVLGQTAQALRITSALAGALTVFALYYFARETLGRGVALIAASYLAASHFHIHFSRIGLNNVWDGLFIVGFSAFLWHAWDFGNESSVGRRFSFVMAGVVLGLAQYFYTSTRVLFPMLFAWLIVAALRERKAVFQRLPGLAAMLLAAAVTFLPLALYFNRHQEEFFAPFKRVAVLGPWLQDEISRTGLPAWRIMAEQFRISALAFTHVEIRMWYQPGTPMLLPAGAALFILGLVLLVSNLLDLRRLWLALWLLSAVTIGALSHGSPAAQRLTVAVPAVAIVLALPLAEAYRWLVHLWPARAAILRAAVGVALAVVVVWDLNFYFLRYSAERRFGDVNTETADVAASFLQDAESGHQVFFLGSPRMGYKSISALPYLLPQVEARDVLQPLSDAPLQALTMPTTFIILPERQAELPLLQERYPGGVLTEHSGKDSRLLFVAYSLGRPP